MSKEVGKK